ncbi:nucleotidyltransferase domain-containing protein [Magnetospirillum sp. ME-1]|uniref:nucleotidyltransferase domain-containing protein n=1 Tax=Magnetospirillum sp. ME-1 TaxID=1639348 RepID=UPI000A18DFEC|nr:nucleotidyltransferase domain-containing protein [Magnetospirillum sp. ME-1]
MSTPTITFRVKPDRQHAVREIVNAIKDDPGMTAAMLKFIRTRPSLVGGDTAIRNIGPFRNEEAALSFLVGRLKTALRPVALFLFGSRAAGSARPDSDFDILVILPDDESGPPNYFSAYAPVAGCGIGVDVVPCRLADFEVERQRSGTIAFAADNEGRLLYASPGSPFRDRWRGQAVSQ